MRYEEPLSVEDIWNWIRYQKDEGQLYCPYCVTKLVEIEEDEVIELHCPNEMCLFDDGYEKEVSDVG